MVDGHLSYYYELKMSRRGLLSFIIW